MTLALHDRLDELRRWMDQWSSALVAYSGGVDSALVAAVAHAQFGERALACIGVSPSYPLREQRAAIDQAEQLGLPYRLVETEEHLDPDYQANAGDRCFYCKTELYGRLREIADAEGWDIVLDGTNRDDLGDHRPGRVAATNQAVRSPLAELGVTKPQVRELARRLGLPVWDKPAMACLSSRVPAGVTITPELLRQIEAAEDVLAAAGFRQFRVRHHGDLARIELPPEDIPRAVATRESLAAGIQRAGYRFVCIDLAGFRSGSLNDPQAATLSLTIGQSHDRLP